jgi:tetratricopeptide (TPR) repeat protein
MFNIFKSASSFFGGFLGLNKEKHQQNYPQEEQKPPNPLTNTNEKNNKKNYGVIDKVGNFFEKSLAFAIVEYRIIKDKLQDLSQTNYNLGLQHLDIGNIKEATFRFKITKRFWPHNYDAYYQLIYCLILSHKFEAAQKVIDELLQKNPSYKPKIDQLLGNSPENHSEEETKSENNLVNNQQNS